MEGPEALEAYLVRESGPLGAVSDPDEMIGRSGKDCCPTSTARRSAVSTRPP
jgi:hypothetical protein